MAYANTFKRKEMKFLLNEEQYERLMKEIEPYMTADEYGVHTILNIYFDSDSNDVVLHSLSKPAYKEKLRLRAYGKSAQDDSEAFLEIKKKYRGVVYKRRLEMTYKQLYDYAANGITPDVRDKDKQVFGEIEYFIKRLQLKPKIVICYDRQAFFGKQDKEFRMTFDGNVRSRRTELDLRSGDSGIKLPDQPYRVMEVKVSTAVPLWLVRFLSENKIYTGSFSKYGNIYMNEVKNQTVQKVKSQTVEKIPDADNADRILSTAW